MKSNSFSMMLSISAEVMLGVNDAVRDGLHFRKHGDVSRRTPPSVGLSHMAAPIDGTKRDRRYSLAA